jgi:hypothetical protein
MLVPGCTLFVEGIIEMSVPLNKATKFCINILPKIIELYY